MDSLCMTSRERHQTSFGQTELLSSCDTDENEEKIIFHNLLNDLP